MANKMTVAQLNAQTDERFAQVNSTLDKLTSMVSILAEAALAADQAKQPKKPEQPKDDEWLKPCPDYATAAQRVEYDKLAEKAKKQRPELMKSLGTKSIKAFIPVPKKDTTRMPHTIRWDVTYS